MKRIAKYISVMVGAVVLGGAGLALGNEELRLYFGYTLFPKVTRNAAFARYTSVSGVTVYHLGTIHGRHLENPDFGLGHLQAVIENLKPTMLMVEVLPLELEAGNSASGPLEMPVATLIAQAAGIEVKGIDWWVQSAGVRTTSDVRDDKMFENLQAALPSEGTVLVLTGFSHWVAFRSRYAVAGFTKESFTDSSKNKVFGLPPGPFRFPAGTDETIRRAMAWASKRMNETDDATMKHNYEGKKRILEDFQNHIAAIKRVSGKSSTGR